MAKVYTVSKAFQSTDRNTKEPEVVKTGNGEFHKFLFQVEGQGKPGWMQMLKKIGNTLEPGDEIYGIIDEWDDGKAKWAKMQVPADIQLKQAPRANATAEQLASGTSAAPQSQPSGELEEKVDYLISLVEGFLESQGHSAAGAQKSSTSNTQDDELDINEFDV